MLSHESVMPIPAMAAATCRHRRLPSWRGRIIAEQDTRLSPPRLDGQPLHVRRESSTMSAGVEMVHDPTARTLQVSGHLFMTDGIREVAWALAPRGGK
jgi:hypothetical protein